MTGALNELALFAGAGGGILGGVLNGWRTICAVENDAYARDVLVARQNDGTLAPFPIWDDVRTFNGRPWCGVVDVVSGGFPCQDISAAGAGAGITGARSGLWKEMARIVCEVRPRYVLVENSPVLTSRGLGVVLGDLAAMGYDARWGVLGAADAIWTFGAPCADHLRERIWICAFSDAGHDRLGVSVQSFAKSERSGSANTWRDGEVLTVADTDEFGRNGWTRDERQADRRAQPTDSGCIREVSDAAINGRRSGWAGRSDSSREGQREQSLPEMADAQCPERWPQGTGSSGDTRSEHADRLLEREEDSSWIGTSGDLGRTTLLDADGAGFREQRIDLTASAEFETAECPSWWSVEPELGRVAHGVANRVDRLRGIGNGQVPAVVALAWAMLREVQP